MFNIMKKQNSNKRKPGNKVGGRPDDSLGQNPFYPGEGAQNPEKVIEADGEKTFINTVDSLPYKPGSKPT